MAAVGTSSNAATDRQTTPFFSEAVRQHWSSHLAHWTDHVAVVPQISERDADDDTLQVTSDLPATRGDKRVSRSAQWLPRRRVVGICGFLVGDSISR